MLNAPPQTPEFGTSESFSEAQQNIENLNEEIRQHEVHITKAEARLAVLRGEGVDVAKWLQKAGDSQDKHSDLSSVSSLGLGELGSHASIASIYTNILHS